MPSSKLLKERIESIQDTMKITNAMYLISSSKLRKALMEMLKQPLYQPKSDAEQVVTLVLASHGVLDELPTAELRTKTSAFVRQFRADVSGTMEKIQTTGKIEPEQVDAILNAWKAYAGGDSHAVQ